MRKQNKTIVIILIIQLFFISSCSDNNYQQFAEEFEGIYNQIIITVDTDDALITMKNLQSLEVNQKIKELEILLQRVEDNIPSNRNEEYRRFVSRYKGLVLIRDSYKDMEKLSEVEKVHIYTEIIRIGYVRKNLND